MIEFKLVFDLELDIELIRQAMEDRVRAAMLQAGVTCVEAVCDLTDVDDGGTVYAQCKTITDEQADQVIQIMEDNSKVEPAYLVDWGARLYGPSLCVNDIE